MPVRGWQSLLPDANHFRGENNFPIPAYSEFMPPPRLGLHPYGGRTSSLFDEEDPWGWPISEYEQAFELQPGMKNIARRAVKPESRWLSIFLGA